MGRPTPYITSVVVHVIAMAAMAYCAPPMMRWEVAVTKGKPVVAVYLAPTIASEPPPSVVITEDQERPVSARSLSELDEFVPRPVEVAKKTSEVNSNEPEPVETEVQSQDSPRKVEKAPLRRSTVLEEFVTEDGELPKTTIAKTVVENVDRNDSPSAEIPVTESKSERTEEIQPQVVQVTRQKNEDQAVEREIKPADVPDRETPKIPEEPLRRKSPILEELVVTDSKPNKTVEKKNDQRKEFQVQRSVAMPFQSSTDQGAEVDQLPQKLPQNAPPLYPQDALLAGVQGRVTLLVMVTSEGTVRKATVDTTSGHRSLDSAAITAVLGWRFEPARRRGTAVDYEVLVPVSFSIRRG